MSALKKLDEAYANAELKPYIDRIKELEAKVEAANKIITEITQNNEYQCFYENGLIPCKANCARYYEKLCERILELKLTLEIPRKEAPP